MKNHDQEVTVDRAGRGYFFAKFEAQEISYTVELSAIDWQTLLRYEQKFPAMRTLHDKLIYPLHDNGVREVTYEPKTGRFLFLRMRADATEIQFARITHEIVNHLDICRAALILFAPEVAA